MKHRFFPMLFALGLSALGPVESRADLPALALKPISLSQLISPVSIGNARDGSGRLFICEQLGQIRIIKDEMLLPVPFLDLSSKLVPKAPTSYLFPLSQSYDERGLLSVAFHPNFNSKNLSNQPLPGYGKFYVFYSAPSPNPAPTTNPNPVNCRTTISEFQVSALNPNVADPNSERIVLSFDKPQSNHNGGQLQFGPDGYLYISVGDGGGQHDNQNGHTGGSGTTSPGPSGALGNAQDKTRLLGKILRIDPLGTNGPGGQYGIPATNPFAGAGGGVREEIYAFGVRNPWRFSFDDGLGGSGRLFEGDVGQDKVEEVNIIVSGGNYGWRVKEGTFNHDATAPNGGTPLIDPIAEYAHIGTNIGTPALPQIGAAVTGGYVYRGSAIPGLSGKYLFADWSPSIATAGGTLLGLEEVPINSNNWLLSEPIVAGGNPLTTRISALGRDEQGELYLATKVVMGTQLGSNGNPTGGIYKIVPAQVSTTTVAPYKDNSIYSDYPSNSNAIGSLYAGTNATGSPRRALLAFDIAGHLPAGAIVSSASLSLHLSQSASGTTSNMTLYRLIQDWGEGTSQQVGSAGGKGEAATTNDATWTARFYDSMNPTLWSTSGGFFNSTPSATTSVASSSAYYSWSSAQLATDVQGWFNIPATNYGWVLLGDETKASTANVFDSREGVSSAQPLLQINYNPVPPPLTRRESWLRQYFPTPGTYVDDLADYDGDGLANLTEYAFSYSPLTPNAADSGLHLHTTQLGGNVTLIITFRRDPRATDLTYSLQTSSDLANWTTIAQSGAGSVPSGSGFVSEADAPGESPVKIVTASELLSSPPRRFVRIMINRTQ